MAGAWCLASWDMLSWCHSSSSVNHSTLCFHWCAAQLRLSCCNSLCVSCSSLNLNWIIKEVPCWQAFWSYSILAFLPLSCDSHPNARNLWNHSWSRHWMIWLCFSRWLYPLLSWCGKIPFSDQRLRQDLNWNFIFFALMLIMEAWSYMELSDSNLKLRFLLLIWLFKWQLGAMDISDSDSVG